MAGIALGHFVPGVFETLRAMEIARVNLPVVAAISLFGLESRAALATVVGVLVEVPVMLSVVWFVNLTKVRYERNLRT